MEYGPVDFFVIYTAVINGAEGAGSLLSFGPNMAQASAAANRILSFRVQDTDTAKTAQVLEDTDGGVQIDLQDIHFKYPTRDVPVFTGLNLTVGTSKLYTNLFANDAQSDPKGTICWTCWCIRYVTTRRWTQRWMTNK